MLYTTQFSGVAKTSDILVELNLPNEGDECEGESYLGFATTNITQRKGRDNNTLV
jgi:hypothetical protein